MPDNVITTLISATAIVTGSLIGAICSYFISKKTTSKSIKEQYRINEENRKYDERYKIKEMCTYANVVRLDICTAIFQSIRTLQNKEKTSYLYILPISKEYQKAVASLSDKYTLKDLSYIYQLYGIIEKVNKDIFNWKYGDLEEFEMIKLGLKDIVIKIYGDNYKKVLNIDIEEISYQDLYNNDLIKSGYKTVLSTLDCLCYIEKIKKDRND